MSPLRKRYVLLLNLPFLVLPNQNPKAMQHTYNTLVTTLSLKLNDMAVNNESQSSTLIGPHVGHVISVRGGFPAHSQNAVTDPKESLLF